MTGLMLVELNEINFDLVRRYIKQGANLPALTQLTRHSEHLSSSEDIYDYLGFHLGKIMFPQITFIQSQH